MGSSLLSINNFPAIFILRYMLYPYQYRLAGILEYYPLLKINHSILINKFRFLVYPLAKNIISQIHLSPILFTWSLMLRSGILSYLLHYCCATTCSYLPI